jgi:hypothetical protein
MRIKQKLCMFNVKTFVFFFLSLFLNIIKGGVGLFLLYRLMFTYHTLFHLRLHFLSLHIEYMIRHWPHIRHRIHSPIVTCVFVAAGMRLPSCCSATLKGRVRKRSDLISLLLLFSKQGNKVTVAAFRPLLFCTTVKPWGHKLAVIHCSSLHDIKMLHA